jgi:hypothetical protein
MSQRFTETRLGPCWGSSRTLTAALVLSVFVVGKVSPPVFGLAEYISP